MLINSIDNGIHQRESSNSKLLSGRQQSDSKNVQYTKINDMAMEEVAKDDRKTNAQSPQDKDFISGDIPNSVLKKRYRDKYDSLIEKTQEFSSEQKIMLNPDKQQLQQESSEAGESQFWENLSNPINQSFNKRKCTRFFLHLGIFIILGFIFSSNMIFLKRNLFYDIKLSNTNPTRAISINMEIANCVVNLNPEVESGDTAFSVFVNKKTMLMGGEERKGENVFTTDFDDDNGVYSFRFLSSFRDLKYCIVHIKFGQYLTDIGLARFNYTCEEDQKCYFVQNNTQFIVQQMIFNSLGKRGSVNANFGNLAVRQLIYGSESYGSLFLHNANITDEAYITISTGTVVIQSTQEFELDWKNNAQSFCFSSPFFNDIDKSTWNCDLSDESGTNDKINDCEGWTRLCRETDQCTPSAVISVNVGSGNIYANLLEKVYADPATTSHILKSKLYVTKKMGFETKFEKQIDSIRNSTSDIDAIFKITLGQQHLQTTSTSYWVFTQNPGFLYFKPWIMSTLSMDLLASEIYEMEGFMMPGLCPYRPLNTISKYAQMNELLVNKFGKNNKGKLVFIQPPARPFPNNTQEISSGMEPYQKNMQFEEKWYEVQYQKEVIELQEITIYSNPLLIATLAVSIVVAMLISFICVMVCRVRLFIFNQELIDTCSHHNKYSQLLLNERQRQKKLELEQYLDARENLGSLEQDIEQQVFQVTNKVTKSFTIPNIQSIFDYYAYISVKKYMVDSATSFFAMIFRVCTKEEILLMKTGELNADEYLHIKERELKDLYQQYCFLNHYPEAELNSKSIVKLLKKKYGYIFESDEDHSQVFIKLIEKNIKLIPNQKDIGRVDSLKLFMSCYYSVTGLESDTEWVEDLKNKYSSFCKKYRIPIEIIRPQQLAEELGIRVIYKSSLMLRRINDMDFNANQASLLQVGQLDLLKMEWKSSAKKQVYFIDKAQLETHFDIIVNPDYFMEKNIKELSAGSHNQKKANIKESVSVLNKTIFCEKWFLTDLMIVVFFWVIYAIMVFPFFSSAIFLNLVYSRFSLNYPSEQFTKQDLKYDTLNFFNEILDQDERTKGAMYGTLIFLVLVHFDKMLQYKNSRFPEDKSFLYSQTKDQSRLRTFYYLIQLIGFLLALWIFLFYLVLVMLWLLLGGIINPDKYLVYATAVITLLTTVLSKAKSFAMLNVEAMERISSEVSDYFLKNTKDIAQHLINEVQNEELKQVNNLAVDGGEFQDLDDCQGMNKEVQKFKNKVNMFFKDPTKYMEHHSSGEVIGQASDKADVKDIKLFMNDMKEEFLKRARTILEEKCKELNIPNKLFTIFDKALFQKSESIEKQINEIFMETESSQMSEKLIRWIIKIASDKDFKNLQPEEMKLHVSYLRDQLIDSLLEIIIPQLFLNDSQLNIYKNGRLQLQTNSSSQGSQLDKDKEEREQIEKNLDKIQQVFHKFLLMIRVIEKNDQAALLKFVIDIMLLLPKDNSWAQDKNSLFMFKCLNLLLQLTTGQTNTMLLRQSCLEALEVLNIPEKLGMFLSLVLSLNSESSWSFGDLKISKQSELWQFIKQFLKELNYPKEVASLFTFFFSFIFQITKGQNPNIEKLYKVLAKQQKVVVAPQTKEFIRNSLNLQQIIVNSGSNYCNSNKRLSSNSGVYADFIQEVASLGTKNFYCIFVSNRMEELYSSSIIDVLSKDMRINPKILLGLVALFHKEEGSIAEQCIDALISEITQTLKINIVASKKILLSFIQIANSTSPFEVEAILHNILEMNDERAKEVVAGLQNAFCQVNDIQTRQDIGPISDKSLSEMKQFISKPFFAIKKKYFTSHNKKNNSDDLQLSQKIQSVLIDYFSNGGVQIKKVEVRNSGKQKKQDGPKGSNWNIFNKMQALVHPETEGNNAEILQFTMKKFQQKHKNFKQRQLQEDDFEDEEKLDNLRQNTDADEDDDENEEIQRQKNVKSYIELMKDISNKKPLLMFDSLYKEIKDIFICKEAGIRQYEEAQFVIDCICNFLKLRYLQQNQKDDAESQTKRDYLVKKVCATLAKTLNLPAISFTHFFNLLLINHKSFDALYYFITTQKENIFINPAFFKEDAIVQTSVRQVIEYIEQQENIVYNTNFTLLEEYFPQFTIKYRHLILDLLFRFEKSQSRDMMASFAYEVIEKLRAKPIFADRQNFVDDIEKIVYSLIFFRNLEFRDFAKEIVEYEGDSQGHNSNKLTNKPRMIHLLNRADNFLKGVLNGNKYLVADVVAEKFILQRKSLIAVVLIAMLQNRALSSDSGSAAEGGDGGNNLEESSDPIFGQGGDDNDEIDHNSSNKFEKTTQIFQKKKGYAKFITFFPYLKYYFTSDPFTFAKFAIFVLRSKFDFQALTEGQVDTFFSLFSPEPQFEQLSLLLKISSYNIEIPHLIAQLIFNSKKDKVIMAFRDSPNMGNLCNRLNASEDEFIILLKLFYRCLSIEDLDSMFNIFSLKSHFDSSFVKGLYSFVAPQYLMKGWKKLGMTSIFNSGFELRNQLILKMFPHYQEKHFAAIELVHNIKKGYWLNVMIMRDTFPIFREARTFGGKRLIRDLTCSILGFMKAEMSQNNFDYIKTNLTQIFKTFDQKKKLKNDWITSFYVLVRSANLNANIFINHLIAEEKKLEKKKESLGPVQFDEEIFIRNFDFNTDDDTIFVDQAMLDKKNLEDDNKSQKSGKSKQSKASRRKSKMSENTNQQQQQQQQEEEIQEQKVTLNLIQKFNKLSVSMKYQLLDYEFQRNLQKSNAFSQQEEGATQKQDDNKYKFESVFQPIKIDELDKFVVKLSQNQAGQDSNGLEGVSQQQIGFISNKMPTQVSTTIKELYIRIQKQYQEIHIRPNEKKFIIYYLIMYSSLHNLRHLEEERTEILNQKLKKEKLKKDKKNTQGKAKKDRFPYIQAYYIVKIFLEMDLIFNAIDRWGYFQYNEEFSTFQKNLVEQFFFLGLFADNFQHQDNTEQQNNQQQQEKEDFFPLKNNNLQDNENNNNNPEGGEGGEGDQQLQKDEQPKKKIKIQKQMLEWFLNSVFPSSLRDIFLKYQEQNKTNLNFNNLVVKENYKFYTKMADALLVTEQQFQKLLLIHQQQQQQSNLQMNVLLPDENLNEDTVFQLNPLKRIFAHEEAEVQLYFDIKEKFYVLEDKFFIKENKKRNHILEQMQQVSQQFLYLFNRRVDQFEKALLKMSSKRPGILGNQNAIQFIKNLLGSAVSQQDDVNNFMQLSNQLINYLCTTCMNSDVYNIKLFLKVVLADNATQLELNELVQTIMRDKLDLFNVIMFIYGRSQVDQYKNLKINKIFNYKKFPITKIHEKSESEYIEEKKQLLERVIKRIKQKGGKQGGSENEKQFVTVHEKKKVRRKQRINYLSECLKKLLSNLLIDNKMTGYIITLVLCYCGESEAWMDLFDKKMKIYENNKKLKNFLFKLLYMFSLYKLPRNYTQEDLKNMSVFDILNYLEQFNLMSIIKLVIPKAEKVAEEQVIATTANGQGGVQKRRKSDKYTQLRVDLQAVINVFSCLSYKTSELNKNDYDLVAKFLLEDVDKGLYNSKDDQEQKKQLTKSLKYAIRLAFLEFLSQDQKKYRFEMYQTVLKFKNIINIGEEFGRVDQKLRSNIYQLIDLTANLLSGYNESLFTNLIKLEAADSKQIILFASLWMWCNSKYNIQMDNDVSNQKDITNILMLMFLNEMEKFNIKPLNSITNNNYDILLNDPSKLKPLAANAFLTNTEELQTFSQLKVYVYNRMNFNKLDLEEKKLNAKLQQKLGISAQNNNNNNDNPEKKDNSFSNADDQEYQNQEAQNVNQTQQQQQTLDVLKSISNSLKIFETPPDKMKNSFLTSDNFYWLGKQFALFIKDTMQSLKPQESKAFNMLKQEVSNILLIFDDLGPLKKVMYAYIKFIINCTGMFDHNILSALLGFASKKSVSQAYPELVSLIQEFVSNISSITYRELAQILDENLNQIQPSEESQQQQQQKQQQQQQSQKQPVKQVAQTQLQQQAQAQQNSNQKLLRQCLEITIPLLFLGYKQIVRRKYQDTVAFDDSSKKTIEELIQSLSDFSKQINMDQTLQQCMQKLFQLIISIVQGKDKDEIIYLKMSKKGDKKPQHDNPIIDIIDIYSRYLNFSDDKQKGKSNVNDVNRFEMIQKYFSVLESVLVNIEKCFLNLYLSSESGSKITSRIVSIITEFLSQNDLFMQNKQTYSNKIIESIISLVNQDFQQLQEEFFIMFKVGSADAQKFKLIMHQYKNQIEGAIEHMKIQQKKFKNKTQNKKTRLIQIQKKLQRNQNLLNEDLYYLSDTNNDGTVTLNEFRLVLKRLGIILSPHKTIEIFSQVKEPSFIKAITNKQAVMDLNLNKDEFEQALRFIQNQCINITMYREGITIEMITFYIMYLLILLLLVFVFIFLGVQAFTIPGSFGSMVNSTFPVAGGYGASTSVQKNNQKVKNEENVKKNVKLSMKTIQANNL